MSKKKPSARKPAQVEVPAEPVVAEQPAEVKETVKRYTRSFTPEASYDTVALVAVTLHNSIALTDEQSMALQAKIATYAATALKEVAPLATEISDKTSTSWHRVTGDTAESKRVPAQRASGGKRLDAMFETAIDVTKMIARAKELVAAGQSKRDAMFAAAHEQNATDDQLRSLGLVVAVKKANATAAAAA